jgi:hypothetical protein
MLLSERSEEDALPGVETFWTQNRPMRGPILQETVSAESRGGPTPHRLFHCIVAFQISAAVAKEMEEQIPFAAVRGASIFFEL